MANSGERWSRRIWGNEQASDQDWDQASRERWDRIAVEWRDRIAGDWERGWRIEVRPFIERTLDGVIPARILDAGCGAGHLTVTLAERGHQTTGVDISPVMVEAARARGAAAGVDVDFHEGTLADTGLADGAFDLVACITALEWVPDPVAALNEFARVLKPEGRLVVGILSALSPIRSDAYKRFLGVQTTQNSLMPWELTRVLTDLGWTVTAETPSGWLEGLDEARAAAEANARVAQCVCAIWLVAATRTGGPESDTPKSGV